MTIRGGLVPSDLGVRTATRVNTLCAYGTENVTGYKIPRIPYPQAKRSSASASASGCCYSFIDKERVYPSYTDTFRGSRARVSRRKSRQVWTPREIGLEPASRPYVAMHARAATVEAVEPSDGSGDASDDSATIADRLKPIELKRKAKSAAKRKAGDPLARPVLKHPKAGERREGGSDDEVEITGHATAAAAAAHTTSGDEEAPSVPASPTIGQRNQATPRNQPLPAQPSAAFPTRIRAVPEVGSSNAITRVSKVWASGLTPPFGRLLWAARSAVACPGCPWDGAAWHGGCALLPRWWSTPAAPSCRDRGSIPRVGSPRQGVRPSCCGDSASR